MGGPAKGDGAPLYSDGAQVATPRLITDSLRLYGEALDFYDAASPPQKQAIRGASPDLVALAVHHASELQKLEAQLATKTQGQSTKRAVVNEEESQAITKGVSLRDQAYRAMRDAAQNKVRITELDEAFGVADPPEKLAIGLDAMGTLLEDWHSSNNPALVARLNLANLDRHYATELKTTGAAVHTAVAAAAARSSTKGHQAALDREDGVQILLLRQMEESTALEAAPEGTDPPDIKKTCDDMYEKCQDIDGKCTKGYPGCDKYGKTSCARCLEACNAGTQYPPECKCRVCGFKE